MAIIKNSQTANAGESAERREPSYTITGNVNWYNHYREQYGSSLKSSNSTTPGHISRENHTSERYWHPNSHCSTLYNNQGMETT